MSVVMVCQAAKWSAEAQTYLYQLCQVEASVARAFALSQAFLVLVRERRGDDLEAWRAEAMHSGIDELARFARGLQDDLSAITAGLTLEHYLARSRWVNDRVRQAAGHGAGVVLEIGPGEMVDVLVTHCVQRVWPEEAS